jgi:hypothetical protein
MDRYFTTGSQVAKAKETGYRVSLDLYTVQEGHSCHSHREGNPHEHTQRVSVFPLANVSGYEQLTQVDQIAVGILSQLTGRPPAPVSPPSFGPRFLYWAIAVKPLLQILGILIVWRR